MQFELLKSTDRFKWWKRGWSLGYVSAVNSRGRTIWIADAHRGNEKCYVVRANEKLTAFIIELDAAIAKPFSGTQNQVRFSERERIRSIL
jgi:hypothetical protein